MLVVFVVMSDSSCVFLCEATERAHTVPQPSLEGTLKRACRT
jgi:hypothetical protein